MPYLCMAIVAVAAGWLSDKMTQSGLITITTSRKMFHCLGTFGPGIALVILAFAGCNMSIVTISMCVGMGMNGFVYCGFYVSLQTAKITDSYLIDLNFIYESAELQRPCSQLCWHPVWHWQLPQLRLWIRNTFHNRNNHTGRGAN
jgi:hypothetical protein